jgi:GWxTD domain-containing protein
LANIVRGIRHILTVAAFAVAIAHAQPVPWEKWLNEDVIYIIADEERQTFEQLKTDQDRERFVVEFWRIRNPTPAAAENPYKKEHHRRIAFANDHFSVPSGPQGWKTDRGHLYITLGPPDQVDPVGPRDPPGNYPAEIWHYRYIDGIGSYIEIEFDDATRDGNYRFGDLADELGLRYRFMRIGNAEATALLATGVIAGDGRVSRRNFVLLEALDGKVFTSTGPGMKASVRVRPDRIVLIDIPVEVGYARFTMSATITGGPKPRVFSFEGNLCRNYPATDGCLAQPFYQTRLGPLEPGSYDLEATVKVVPPAIVVPPANAAKTYSVRFTVK